MYGDGLQRRDLTYVDDVVVALLLAGVHKHAVGRIFNVGGDDVRLLELARLLIDVRGHGSYRLVPFPKERRAIDIGEYVADSTSIRTTLGWAPRVPLREGLASSMRYLRERAPGSLGSMA